MARKVWDVAQVCPKVREELYGAMRRRGMKLLPEDASEGEIMTALERGPHDPERNFRFGFHLVVRKRDR